MHAIVVCAMHLGGLLVVATANFASSELLARPRSAAGEYLNCCVPDCLNRFYHLACDDGLRGRMHGFIMHNAAGPVCWFCAASECTVEQAVSTVSICNSNKVDKHSL